MGKLIGHSGCYLHLTDDNRVVKTSNTLAYNKRLELQAKKQSEFRNKLIKTPEILSQEYVAGFYSFTMNYIPGRTLAAKLTSEPIFDTIRYLDKLISFIQSNLDNQEGLEEKKVILEKFKSIQTNHELPKYISKWIISVIDTIKIPKGYCHGDLTLENIIVFNDDIYLIDFLDSYIMTPFQDVSKLFQEVYGLWSFRNNLQLNYLTVVRLNHIKKRIISQLNLSRNDLITVDLLTVMNFVRIIPYTKDEILKAKIILTIEKIIAQWK